DRHHVARAGQPHPGGRRRAAVAAAQPRGAPLARVPGTGGPGVGNRARRDRGRVHPAADEPGRLMEKHLLLVFTRPVEGREEEFNRWYDGQHLRDVAGLPGIVSGQRYQFAEASRNSSVQAPDMGYLAIYEVPAGQLENAKAALAETSAERR